MNRHLKVSFTVMGLLAHALSPASANALDDVEGYYAVMPQPGESAMRALTPELLELIRINSEPQGGTPDSWDFVDSSGSFVAPTNFSVTVNGQAVTASVYSFRRRPLYAPLAVRDLRIDNRVFLELSTPLNTGDEIVVTTTGWDGDSTTARTYSTTMEPLRRSSAIHVNQEGYETTSPKKAMVGYYLGSAGELTLPSTSFSLVDDATGVSVFTGTLQSRPDVGFTYTPTPYQKTYSADFSSFQTQGTYRLVVDGLGASLPFRIDNGMMMNFARSYAIGIYNQRCGHAVELPFSRHVHAACHTAPALIPTPEANFANTWGFIASASSDYANNSRHTAPQLKDVASQLYPIIKTGSIDVSGGHHDAGDYSKYTINSAQLVHHLAFGADAFPGVGALDNLGIPESGDGKSDLLQMAKVEADFLAKMQDDDGGFFFLVYPRDRKYENDVLPDAGDQQVVWPKNTSATAAATAALAEMASSPLFKQQFPTEAAAYMVKAQAGWDFLMNAINLYGKDGSYQKLTHYGDIFMHDDELAWAAAAMFAATGDPIYQQKLDQWYDPSASSTRRWGWWHLFESYGCAARTYAFAARSGRLTASQLDSTYLAKCEAEIIAAADDARDRSDDCAYGSSYEIESKLQRTAGWYFSSDRAFDLTTGYQLTLDSSYHDAVIANVNFELGCNPVNVSYLTGSGLKQQREIVHQYAQNDQRVLPPSGIPIGNIQPGFAYIGSYGYELGDLTFPPDGATTAPYPMYDRWGDSYNTMTEFVVPQQGRILASLAYWAAISPAGSQSWTSATPVISAPTDYVPVGQPITVSLSCPGLDLSNARITWECSDQQPWMGGTSWTFTPVAVGAQWVEAEAVLPDGRRVSAAASYSTKFANGSYAYLSDSDTIALYHFDGNFQDSGPNGYHLTSAGNVQLVAGNSGWMKQPVGEVARFSNLGDTLTVTLPDSLIAPGSTATELSLEAWIFPRAYKAYSYDNYPVIALTQHWDSSLAITDGKWNSPAVPSIAAGSQSLLSSSDWQSAIALGTWQRLKITRDSNSEFKVWINDVCVSTVSAAPNYGRTTDWLLTLGNIDADIDEVRISSIVRYPPPPDEFVADANTLALYHFNGDFNDASGNGHHLTANGSATRSNSNLGWMTLPSGETASFANLGDTLTASFADSLISPGNSATPLTIEGWIYPRSYKAYGVAGYPLLSLYQHWDSALEVFQDKWDSPSVPKVRSGANGLVMPTAWQSAVAINTWNFVKITRDANSVVEVWINDQCLYTGTQQSNYGRTPDWLFTLGNFDGEIDEVRISDIVR
ncbi:glycoside hydrolase family 9 protein [Luteolibacter pohnpeiensis]|uniref:Glycoside hydrolase family 9 protein n=1 Tax=Luteolibacter pohnpeiensis TaxID=454153 RepID=A0A934SE29_9BACT|nr:glycoside hydrolase family 9 protein [Luteolibacter pohnpeiensis]MBK1884184.1 glycoside hydrolase family 9 protein [Luteolibacter pohnpeiensis]